MEKTFELRNSCSLLNVNIVFIRNFRRLGSAFWKISTFVTNSWKQLADGWNFNRLPTFSGHVVGLGILLALVKHFAFDFQRKRARCIWLAYFSKLVDSLTVSQKKFPGHIDPEHQERLCDLLKLAPDLGINVSDKEYREACFILASTSIPSSILIPQDAARSNGNDFVWYRKAIVLWNHFIFRRRETPSMDWIDSETFEVVASNPEILIFLRRDYQKLVQEKILITSVTRKILFFKYLAFDSWARLLEYILVLQISALSFFSYTQENQFTRREVNLKLFCILYDKLSRKHNSFWALLDRFTKELGRYICVSWSQSITKLLLDSILDTVLRNISSSHRKQKSREFHETLEKVSTGFLDRHSIDDIECLYYFLHDLEGVETQMQAQVARILNGLCSLWYLCKNRECSCVLFLSSCVISSIIDIVMNRISSHCENLSESRLRSLEQDLSQNGSSVEHYCALRDHEENNILFHDTFYVSLISQLKTFRMMNLAEGLFKEVKESHPVCLSMRNPLFHICNPLTRYWVEMRDLCRAGKFFSIFQALVQETFSGKYVNLSEKTIDLMSLLAHFTNFILLIVRPAGNVSSTEDVMKIFDAYECYETSRTSIAQWKSFLELVESNETKASKLKEFYDEQQEGQSHVSLLVQGQIEEKPITKISHIQVKNIDFKYPGSTSYTLRNFSLSIPLGCLCVIRGVNGCGKSTLLNLLAQLYPPISGQMSIVLHKESNITSQEFVLDKEHWFEFVSFLPQQHALLPCSVHKNVLCTRELSCEKLDVVCNATRLARDVKGLPYGWQTMLGPGEKVELSKGQVQKLMLARGLLSDASVLILDEPTNFLDKETKESLISYFKTFLRATSDTEATAGYISDIERVPRSVICVSHDETLISQADVCIEFPCGYG